MTLPKWEMTLPDWEMTFPKSNYSVNRNII